MTRKDQPADMEKHDPQSFEQLFDAEPDAPSERDVQVWIDLYSRLVDLLARQLEETRRFVEAMPDAMRQYLSRENEQILVEELDVFRHRLAHWTSLT